LRLWLSGRNNSIRQYPMCMLI